MQYFIVFTSAILARQDTKQLATVAIGRYWKSKIKIKSNQVYFQTTKIHRDKKKKNYNYKKAKK